jgi:hypothetical protein
MRLIDADAAIDALKELTANGTNKGMVFGEDAVHRIEILPSVQPEHKTGHWVETGDEPYDEWECDVCGFAIDGSGCIDPEEYRDVYKFCPNCGADMRGEAE